MLNFKFSEKENESYRQRIIKKGENMFVAPEMLKRQKFGQEIDLFCIGVCLFFTIFKKSPYLYVRKTSLDERVYDY